MGTKQGRKIHRWEFDPHCPLDFRFRDAQHLAESAPTQWADEGDPLVLDCAEYLRALNSAETGRERVAARARFPLIRATVDFAEEQTLRRAEVQARMLAGQTDRQIAARCKIRPKLVGCFERLHFAVRHCLRATDYLMIRAVGRGAWEGFRNDQVGEFWNWCALAGGVVLLDYMVERLRDVLEPGQEPSLLAYLGDCRVPLVVQGFVAAHAVPFVETTADVWVECGARVSKSEGDAEKQMAQGNDIRRVLIRLARAHLAGKPLPIRPLAPVSKRSKAGDRGASRSMEGSITQARKRPTLGDVAELLAAISAKPQ